MDYILLWLIIILLLTIIIKKNLNRFRQKYIEYKNNQIITYNNIDNDILNEYSQFLIGSITKIFIMTESTKEHIDDNKNKNDAKSSPTKGCCCCSCCSSCC
jgi:hypothetical protein